MSYVVNCPLLSPYVWSSNVSKSALLTPSKGLLWLQPVEQAVFKPLTGFTLKPKTAIDSGCFLFPPRASEII
jgi:hypothetical protein